jgi:hypothetical protein
MLGAGTGVETPLQAGELALELAPALVALPRERAIAKRLSDRATRLALVGAVGEPAGGGQRGDVLEGLLEAL